MKQIIYELQKWNENEEMIVAVNAIYAIAKRSLKKKIQDFNGFKPRWIPEFFFRLLYAIA